MPSTTARVTYDGTTTHQGRIPNSLRQIDWDTTGLILAGGTKRNFGVGGTILRDGGTLIFHHAPKAGLGGVPEGADGSIQGLLPNRTLDRVLLSAHDGWDINLGRPVRRFPNGQRWSVGLGGVAAGLRRRFLR